jgi:hypothetical protein
MPELGQLYLQLAFKTPRSLRKNIENKAGSVHHTTAQFTFEITFLAGAEGRRRNDEFGLILIYELSKFVQLALADEVSGVRAPACTDKLCRNYSTRRACQFGKLLAFRIIG